MAASHAILAKTPGNNPLAIINPNHQLQTQLDDSLLTADGVKFLRLLESELERSWITSLPPT